MRLEEACVGCIINQSLKVADAIGADNLLTDALVSAVTKSAQNFSFKATPPEIAADVYEMMAQMADKEDLYDEVKAHSTQKALSFVPYMQDKIDSSDNKLLTATKVAVAGNVIDLAAEVEFDLADEVAKIFDTHFDYDDFDKLRSSLERASTLLYIGDNVGEHIFDYLFIQTLCELYPSLEIFYMVRGCPIINDVTMKEAEEAGFDKLCTLIDSGVNTPGFTYKRANQRSKKLFDTADLIITKGMGNYECLSPAPRENLVYLLKVKCSVVAASLGKNIGDIVCKMA
jgi:damage-control phosphatase, subfamily I